MFILRTVLLGLLLIAAGGAGANAASSAWEHRPEGDVRLVSAVDGVGGLDEIPLGLEFRLQPHWKTYWRAPGEGGLPPTLDWSGSTNLKSATLAWPAPRRLTILGIDSIGYEGNVVLPIRLQPANPGRPVSLRLAVDFLTCATICVPQHAVLSLDLPARVASPSAEAHAIDRARGAVPPGPSRSLEIMSASVAGTRLHVVAAAAPPLVKPDLFVEAGPDMLAAAPRVTLADGGRRAEFDVALTPQSKHAALAAGRAVTFTLVDGDRALEQRVALSAAPVSGAGELVLMLAVALLGGLILNLMPCVLPVLSIKLLGFVGHGGGERRAARWSFLATAAGVVTSFMALAAAAIGLKLAGHAVGWGIQFQQPVFLAAMIAVLALFAANLAGLFEFALPSAVGSWAGATGAVDGRGRRGALVGAFATGLLATLLATPCSAPFVGTALGFALARGPLEIALIFLALGLGLAAPYIVVALFPGLATRLPRPGRWMVQLRRALAIAVLATAGWLVTVLAAVADWPTAAVVGAAALAAPIMLALGRLVSGIAGRIAAVLLVAVAVSAPLLLERPSTAAAASAASADRELWARFDQARITHLVSAGQVVLVDVTADWCITCKVNKATVLSSEQVRGLLRSGRVVGLVADWTRPDPAIAGYLASFGRYGIPFNAVYGPKAPEGIPLPELLTIGDVTNAIAAAGGG